LNQKFSTGEYENWRRYWSVLLYIRAAMSQRPESQGPLLNWAIILYNGIWYVLESDSIADSRNMGLKSRKQRIKLLDTENKETLASAAILARLYLLEDRRWETEKLNMQVLKTRKKKLGVDHPDTFMNMVGLAFAWKSSGHGTQALNLLRDCLAKQKQILGLNHHQTLSRSGFCCNGKQKLNINEQTSHMFAYNILLRSKLCFHCTICQ